MFSFFFHPGLLFRRWDFVLKYCTTCISDCEMLLFVVNLWPLVYIIVVPVYSYISVLILDGGSAWLAAFHGKYHTYDPCSCVSAVDFMYVVWRNCGCHMRAHWLVGGGSGGAGGDRLPEMTNNRLQFLLAPMDRWVLIYGACNSRASLCYLWGKACLGDLRGPEIVQVV